MTGTVQVVVDGTPDAGAGDRIAAATALHERWFRGGRIEVVCAQGGRRDPYGLGDAHDVEADDRSQAVVLVGPRRRGARGSVPGPVVGGRPVALVQADTTADLPPRLSDPDPGAPWVVAAMAKNVFLAPTEQWAQRLADGGRTVVDVRADRARRSDLIEALAAGPSVVLYAGHGRPRGWAGYQALRIHHLLGSREDDGAALGETRAIGLVVAFACDTLSRSRNQWPFGARLVDTGRVRAYLAPASKVVTAEAEVLADIVVQLLAAERPATVAALMAMIDRCVAGDRVASRAWRTFRLVGDPSTELSRA